MIDIAGKPLISYVLDQCKLITNDVYVSSDDRDILDFCVKSGVNTIVRPKELATDFSKSEEAIEHLFRVSSSLDSMVLGEAQILGQVKDAYSLAKNGHHVLMLERGKEPGSKNVYGGRIYPYSLSQLIPNFAEDAPIERNVTKESIMFMTEKASFQTTFSSDSSINHGFTAFRSEFDKWFANKAVEMGAELFTEVKVDNVVTDDKNCIIGIKSGDDEITSKLVIAAD